MRAELAPLRAFDKILDLVKAARVALTSLTMDQVASHGCEDHDQAVRGKALKLTNLYIMSACQAEVATS